MTSNILANDQTAEHILSRADLEKIIAIEEKRHGIPEGLLRSIAVTESGMTPYILGEKGRALIFSTIDDAASTLESMIKLGKSNIDIGIMQINYKWHHSEFTDIKDMLNPISNVTYAAKMLRNLKHNHGSWQKAVRFYHSGNENFSKKYSRKVTLAWIGT